MEKDAGNAEAPKKLTPYNSLHAARHSGGETQASRAILRETETHFRRLTTTARRGV